MHAAWGEEENRHHLGGYYAQKKGGNPRSVNRLICNHSGANYSPSLSSFFASRCHSLDTLT